MKRKRDGGSGLIFRDDFEVKLNKRKIELFVFPFSFHSFQNNDLHFIFETRFVSLSLAMKHMWKVPLLLHQGLSTNLAVAASVTFGALAVTFRSVLLRQRCQLGSKLLPLHFRQHTLQTQHPSSSALLSRSVFNKLPPELVSIRAQWIDPKQKMERTQLLLENSLS